MDDYLHKHIVIFEDGLPYPYVEYQPPEFFVLRFSKEKDSEKYVCGCFKNSIDNYWKRNIDSWEMYGENGWEIGFKEGRLGLIHMKYYKQYKDGYQYKDGICHRCNGGVLPSIVSESRRKTLHLPWYKMRMLYLDFSTLPTYPKIKEFDKQISEIQNQIEQLNPSEEILKEHYKEQDEKQKFLSKFSNEELSEIRRKQFEEFDLENIPTEEELIKDPFSRFYGRWNKVIRDKEKEQYELQKEIDKVYRKKERILENYVREDFGLKLVGEQWVNETLIYKLCKQIFKNEKVIQHYRPKELQGLELDIYLKERRIGIEYMGKQHYKPIKHFGGKKSLEKTKERDKKKILLCEELGIQLIHIKYDETVSKDLIIKRISELE